MSWLEMPTRSDIPAYQYQIALENVVYTLSFAYNARTDRWTLDILDQSENPLAMGLLLVVGTSLAGRFLSIATPPGDFYLYDTTGENGACGMNDLGTKFKLLYEESGT